MSTMNTTESFKTTTKSGLAVELPNFTTIPFDMLEAWMDTEALKDGNKVINNIKLFKTLPEFAPITAVCSIAETAGIIGDWIKSVQADQTELGK